MGSECLSEELIAEKIKTLISIVVTVYFIGLAGTTEAQSTLNWQKVANVVREPEQLYALSIAAAQPKASAINAIAEVDFLMAKLEMIDWKT